MLVDLNNISKNYGEEVILENCNLSINDRDRIGLIGVNGAGKSTLLNIISGNLNYDDGKLFIKKGLEIGYLKQNNALDTSNSINDEIKSVFADLIKIGEKLEEMRKKGELDAEYSRLNEFFESKDGYNIQTKINIVLNGMGFRDYDKNTIVSKLSGGEKNRLAFAKLLLKEPELLILDEPTNHLDFEALAWLEEYLEKYKGAIIVVSHDRYFLDKISESICEIEDHKLIRYKGGYSQFVRQKEERVALEEKQYEKQQEEIEKMRDFVAKNLAKSASINSVGSRVKALEKMEIMAKPKVNRKKISLKFNTDIEPFKNVFHGENIKVTVGTEQKLICENIDFDIQRGEKIAIIGLNGVGKSSFIKALLGKIKFEGKARWSDNLKISYFAQENEQLNPENTILEEVHSRFPLKPQEDIRATLGMLLLSGDDVFKKIKDLSGGERAKVAFAIIMIERANFIVMDEPTNHLDYQSKEVLEQALKDYKGTLLFISHDRYMLNRVPTKIIEMFSNKFEIYDGGYDYYLSHKKVEKVETTKKEQSENSKQYFKSKEQRAEEVKLRNKKKALEKRIAELEEKIKRIQEEMAKPEIVADYIELNKLCEEMESYNQELEQKMEEWIELN
ncbi:MAG: ABC-F family ATP-binding cassette domain-containing protein [Clostridiales bacterium]|nr:ABC-F family ATP-binding cassette domain-containing protein [Clostridiales bacterium]